MSTTSGREPIWSKESLTLANNSTWTVPSFGPLTSTATSGTTNITFTTSNAKMTCGIHGELDDDYVIRDIEFRAGNQESVESRDYCLKCLFPVLKAMVPVLPTETWYPQDEVQFEYDDEDADAD